MATASGGSGTNGLNLDQVAEFLLRNQYLLTSLELYQESVERGQENARLKTLFTPQKLEEVTAGEDAAAWTSASNFMRPGRGNAGKGAATSQTSAELANRVSLLEYELRQERQKSQELRGELTKLLALKEAIPPAQQTDASAYRKSRAPSSIECRIMNFLIKKFLVAQGYKLTAISLSSEVRTLYPLSPLFFALFCLAKPFWPYHTLAQFVYPKPFYAPIETRRL